jgi:hypothetical protein
VTAEAETRLIAGDYRQRDMRWLWPAVGSSALKAVYQETIFGFNDCDRQLTIEGVYLLLTSGPSVTSVSGQHNKRVGNNS